VSANSRALRYALGWLIAGTRGGMTRAKIIKALREVPQNTNQLATGIGMDYRAIKHHLDILQKNKLVTVAGEGYGTTYFLSSILEENYTLFEEILNKIGKKQKRK
jgi:DNA-binding transcriptional ArsR family regulator